MKLPEFAPLYLALVHHPVLNRHGETIASAVTNLDLHDLGRLVCTYDMPACFIVTPLEDQQRLVHTLLDHWVAGVGKTLHPDRAQALRRLCTVSSVEKAVAAVREASGKPPRIWATTARAEDQALSHAQARCALQESATPHLLLLGTGWGLAPELFAAVDAVLAPIRGRGAYNHLSVRCAAAILIDRLLGESR